MVFSLAWTGQRLERGHFFLLRALDWRLMAVLGIQNVHEMPFPKFTLSELAYSSTTVPTKSILRLIER